jgi:hypothetical protein
MITLPLFEGGVSIAQAPDIEGTLALHQHNFSQSGACNAPEEQHERKFGLAIAGEIIDNPPDFNDGAPIGFVTTPYPIIAQHK